MKGEKKGQKQRKGGRKKVGKKGKGEEKRGGKHFFPGGGIFSDIYTYPCEGSSPREVTKVKHCSLSNNFPRDSVWVG